MNASRTDQGPGARRRRGVGLGIPILISTVVGAAVLSVAWVSGWGDDCGGVLPGCGNLRNAGERAVSVQATGASAVEEPDSTLIAPGQRGVLVGVTNHVRVDAGECLIVDGGPFWQARTVIDRTAQDTGVWHRIDDWGARVTLHEGDCTGPDR